MSFSFSSVPYSAEPPSSCWGPNFRQNDMMSISHKLLPHSTSNNNGKPKQGLCYYFTIVSGVQIISIFPFHTSSPTVRHTPKPPNTQPALFVSRIIPSHPHIHTSIHQSTPPKLPRLRYTPSNINTPTTLPKPSPWLPGPKAAAAAAAAVAEAAHPARPAQVQVQDPPLETGIRVGDPNAHKSSSE